MSRFAVWFVVAGAAACTGKGHDSDDDASGGATQAAGTGGSAQAGAATQAGRGGRAGASAASGAGGGSAASGRAGTGGAGASDGGRGGAGAAGLGGGASGSAGRTSEDDELAQVFNLVDAAAVAELEAYLVAGETGPHPLSDPGGLTLGVNGFLDAYLEDYDFVFLMMDHEITTNTYGKFESINQALLPGTGNDLRFRRPGYKTNGRLKGVAGFKYVPGGFGPYAHEMLHYWANELDPSFGFGIGLDFDSRAHWGYADIHGQLGGYAPASLECTKPAGQAPPDCTAEAGGRYRYVTSFFGANANGAGIPYAPFELYLMGLLPRAELTSDLHVLVNAEFVSQNAADETEVLEADGIKTVPLADIVARHGEVLPLSAAERALKVAMVVVSAAPAAPDVLAEYAHANAVFGNRAADPDLPSFESLTGGRATLDTRLGPRRTSSDPPAEEVPLPKCDVLAQDCDPPGASCLLNGQDALCALSTGHVRNEPCSATGIDCAPGLTCGFDSSGTATFCTPYCEPSDATSPIYCETLCDDYLLLGTPEGELICGVCRLP